MDVQQHLSTCTRISKRKNKATLWITRHYFPIALQNSSWLHTEASLAKVWLQCCTPQLWWAKALEALGCWSGFKADNSEEFCANSCTLRHWELPETGKQGEANVAYIWNNFQLWKKNHYWTDVEWLKTLFEKNKTKLNLNPTWNLQSFFVH